MITRFFHTAGLVSLVAIAPAAFAGGPSDEPSEGTVITVTLSENSNGDRAILRVPDGIDFRTVTSIAGAIQEFGTSDIALSIAPDGEPMSPRSVTGDKHAGIHVLRERAEIYVTNDMPFAFVQLLSERVKQLEGVDGVALKSTRFKASKRAARGGADPFGGPAAAASATVKPDSASADPFGG